MQEAGQKQKQKKENDQSLVDSCFGSSRTIVEYGPAVIAIWVLMSCPRLLQL